MSRVAKKPIALPKGTEFTQSGESVTVKGSKGTIQINLHPSVQVVKEGDVLTIAPGIGDSARIVNAIAGTMRALIQNMVTGVSQGFERKLTLVGIGYRAQAQGDVLNLTLGFSHPVQYTIPNGITIETPTQTEILVKGIDKQIVGQVAADIRAYRPPEPYKGKGVRYSDEVVQLKEGKKK